MSTIQDTIARELRMFGLLSLPERVPQPPPFDVDREERLLAAAMHGAELPAWFRPSCCYVPIVRYSLAALTTLRSLGKVTPNDLPIAEVVEALQRAGFHGPDLLIRELLEICHRAGCESVTELCRMIAELHRRRVALDRLATLDTLLRCPESDAAQVDESLRSIGAALKEPSHEQ